MGKFLKVILSGGLLALLLSTVYGVYYHYTFTATFSEKGKIIVTPPTSEVTTLVINGNSLTINGKPVNTTEIYLKKAAIGADRNPRGLMVKGENLSAWEESIRYSSIINGIEEQWF